MKTPPAWSEYCKSLAPAIVEACAHTSATRGVGGLVKALDTALPEWSFHHALCRGGWYRPGAVVTTDGTRVAEDLGAWAEAGLEACDHDLGALADALRAQHGDTPLHATRLVGKTHYFVAPAGEAPADFLQLEVEELQEMRAHRLFANDPHGLDELIDPQARGAELAPIGLPVYRFRRLQHMGAFLERMQLGKPEPVPVQRLVEDWSAASADTATCFSNHWVLSTRAHEDRFGQPVLHARPIAALMGEPPEFGADPGTNGVALAGALTRFDRAVGYPMAWYFHMLATHAVPVWVAQTVVEDHLGGFAYLPEKDVAVVRRWLHTPYAIHA
ncbi:hypothetical protein G3580_19100 [Nitrogeniibacter mangrovi]|uniref:Uncharacterized protein n=1 Tax=Nitrogeniibacter mangrovi TaxID=2016596 RepID=A0A6C1B993_9RHOO|nr:hypothetical protein [Nitrogeniibacter mangrovi]QID19539.1 hypothetical protein G3580_19100 [Nitrogeniibacter mangrovi]